MIKQQKQATAHEHVGWLFICTVQYCDNIQHNTQCLTRDTSLATSSSRETFSQISQKGSIEGILLSGFILAHP
jgi:hypothetical protein